MGDDGALVQQAVAGDRGAYDALVARWRGPLYRFARRLLHDDAAAEDVLQDTFLTVHRRLADWRAEGSFKSWLFSIARNQVLMLRRRRVGEPATHEPLESLAELGAAAGWGQVMSPHALTERLEQHTQLEQALASLDDEAREVLLLRDVEGLSGEDTAQALGLTLPAMKSRLHRARLRLVAAVKRGALP
ncbi:MAG: RNA polymerase sigma factor [Myxococcus sp.]|nr:RNA polymerase sigma factor [Myxococcus sp.]